MLVLHAGVIRSENLWIWGESSLGAARAAKPPARHARATRDVDAAGALPFGADADELRAALRRIVPDLGGVVDEPVVAWLPAQRGRPFASHPAVAKAPERTSASTPAPARFNLRALAPFEVNALALPRRRAFELCTELFDRTDPFDGVVLGDDLLCWVHAYRLATSLVVRQRYVPGIVASGSTVRSRWHARIEGADEEALAAIAKALPPVARALAVDASPLPPPDGPKSLVRSFVEEAVDALVRDGAREAVSLGGGAAPARSGRPAASIHDEWITSLSTANGELRAPLAEALVLAQAVATWQRPLAISAAAPVRVVFRLEEPIEAVAPPTARWTLRTMLRSAEDRSLLLPLDAALEAKGRAARLLARDGADLREHALVALAQAAAVSPLVARGLRRTLEERVELTPAEAHLFLREHAPALEQAGFQVLLPAWWTNAAARPRLSLRAEARGSKSSVAAGLTLDALVDVDWSAALGDEAIPLAELRALARLKAPLVQVRGRWVEVDAERLRAAIRFIEDGARDRRSARELVAMKLGAAAGFGDSGEAANAGAPPLPVAGVAGKGAIGELLARLDGNATFSEQPEPDGFDGTLRPYQRRGFSWLAFLRRWRLGACLADDMGLGKTVQALALLQEERNGGERRPALLVCPTSVVGNWQREAARFTPGLPVLVHHGGERARAGRFAREARRHALVLTSYALLQRDLEHLAPIEWSGVILDEAQNVKNPETKQAAAARALAAEWRVALTGTPVENHVGDLWSIMEFLNPGLLGTQSGFRREFLRPIHGSGDAEAATRLKRRTGPFVLRRVKSDPAIAPELPAKLEHDVVCNLTREQGSLYAAAVDDAQERIAAAAGIERRGLILALLTRLKQICNHPAQYLADGSELAGRSGKLERLVEMLEEACDDGDRSLVFTQYREMGELIERSLRERLGREVLFLHGGTPRARREEMVARFQAAGEAPPIFLLSLKAGGTGLNLTRASHVFHFDRWWNPAVEDQATDRAHRIGQARKVQVHKLVCAGTLEERIDAMIRRKRVVAEQVVGSGETWLTELSVAELRELVALGEDAVSE